MPGKKLLKLPGSRALQSLPTTLSLELPDIDMEPQVTTKEFIRKGGLTQFQKPVTNGTSSYRGSR